MNFQRAGPTPAPTTDHCLQKFLAWDVERPRSPLTLGSLSAWGNVPGCVGGTQQTALKPCLRAEPSEMPTWVPRWIFGARSQVSREWISPDPRVTLLPTPPFSCTHSEPGFWTLLRALRSYSAAIRMLSPQSCKQILVTWVCVIHSVTYYLY